MGQRDGETVPLTSETLPGSQPEAPAEARRSLLADMYHTKMWRIFPLMLLYIISMTMVMPQVPGARLREF